MFVDLSFFSFTFINMQSIKVFKHFPFVFPIPLCNLPAQVAFSPCHATCQKGNENVVYIRTQSILFSNKKWNFQENEQIWRAFCLLIELVQTQKNRNTCSLSVEDSNNFRIHLGVSVCLFEHMDVHWKSERVIRSTGSGISVVLRTNSSSSAKAAITFNCSSISAALIPNFQSRPVWK